MWYDDLNAPLGQDRARERQSRRKAIILATLLSGGGLIATFTPPLLEQIRPPAAAAFKDANISRLAGTLSQKSLPSTGKDRIPLLSDLPQESDTRRPLHMPSAPDGHPTTGTEASEKQTGIKIVRAGGGGAPEALVIDVSRALGAGGVDGARPSKVYSRPASPSRREAYSPRIALVIGGMGLAAQSTETAISTLPGEVTLGFAPYGSDLARQTALAREAGHEVVLQIPMETFDFQSRTTRASRQRWKSREYRQSDLADEPVFRLCGCHEFPRRQIYGRSKGPDSGLAGNCRAGLILPR